MPHRQCPPGKQFRLYNGWCTHAAGALPRSRTWMWKESCVTAWQHQQHRPDILARAWASTKTCPVVKTSFFEIPSFISIAQKASIRQHCPTQRLFQRQSQLENRSLFSCQLTAQERIAPHHATVRLQPLHQAEATRAFRRPVTMSFSLTGRAE